MSVAAMGGAPGELKKMIEILAALVSFATLIIAWGLAPNPSTVQADMAAAPAKSVA